MICENHVRYLLGDSDKVNSHRENDLIRLFNHQLKTVKSYHLSLNRHEKVLKDQIRT